MSEGEETMVLLLERQCGGEVFVAIAKKVASAAGTRDDKSFDSATM
jgi:hypothetical protein